ncbi:DUF2066 domain-containing protein [Litoribacillus peritrichatus]|uniref:DUF2066 domain-containing protein n=1 Tax=Litoribacillus peritrichatus TaxID=718191 RepID=A0ABP7M463_9GAMM
MSIVRKVVSQNQTEFKAAVQSAFRQYLVHMSGHGSTPDLPQVQSLLVKPEKYLLEFRYEPLAEEELEIGSEFVQTKQAKWLLKLRFDYKAVESALFNVGAPIWQTPRPDLMVWLAYESEDGLRQVITSNEPDALQSVLGGVASTRGLVIKLPLYDDEDREVLPESALWGLFEEELKQVSQSYNESNSIALRVYPISASEWQYDTRLLMPDSSVTSSGVAADKVSAIQAALLDAMDKMADRYALQVDPTQSETVLFRLSGVNTFDQLQGLMAELNKVLMIKNVVPKAARGNEIWLELTIVGNKELLQLTLANFDQLAEELEEHGVQEHILPGTEEVESGVSELSDPLMMSQDNQPVDLETEGEADKGIDDSAGLFQGQAERSSESAAEMVGVSSPIEPVQANEKGLHYRLVPKVQESDNILQTQENNDVLFEIK